MPDPGEPSAKKPKRPEKDDVIPINMQFFKWARMDHLSAESIATLQQCCYGPEKELNDFYFKLMTYYHSQSAKDREYKEKKRKEIEEEEEKKRKAKEEEEEKKHAVTAAKKEEKPPVEEKAKADPDEDDVQFLLERKRAILAEMGASEEADDENESTELEQEEPLPDSPQSPPPPATATVTVEPAATVTLLPPPPAAPVFVQIKQEPPEDPMSAPLSPPPPPPQLPPLPSIKRESPIMIPLDSIAVPNIGSPAESTMALVEEPIDFKAARQMKRELTAAAPAAPQPNTAAASLKPSLKVQLKQAYQQRDVILSAKKAKRERARERLSLLATVINQLNKQINEINEIKSIARAAQLPSLIFHTTCQTIRPPVPADNFTLFHQAAALVDQYSDALGIELDTYPLPAMTHLRVKLRRVKTEVCIAREQVASAERAEAAAAGAAALAKSAAAAAAAAASALAAAAAPAALHTAQRPAAAAGASSDPKKLALKRPHQPPVPVEKRPQETTANAPGRKALLPNPSAADAPIKTPEPHELPQTPQHLQQQQQSTLRTTPNKKSFCPPGACAFCYQMDHQPRFCTVYVDWRARAKRRKELNLCFHCLRKYSKDHSLYCRMWNADCKHCGLHSSHTSLCKKLNHTPAMPAASWSGNNQRVLQEQHELAKKRRQEERMEAAMADDGAVFSPSTTPVYEEVVRTS